MENGNNICRRLFKSEDTQLSGNLRDGYLGLAQLGYARLTQSSNPEHSIKIGQKKIHKCQGFIYYVFKY